MNAAEKRKRMGQIVVLVILLVVLGVSGTFMFRNVARMTGMGRRPQAAAPAGGQQAAASAPAGEAVAAPAGEDGTAVAGQVQAGFNPNVFKVYELSPPKNPFMQEESWYSDELSEYPGYPQMRDAGFFEDMGAAIPPIEGLLEDDEAVQQITLRKAERDESYQFSGVSESGDISTSLVVDGQPGRMIEVNWTPASGVPLSALREPGWEERIMGQPQSVPSQLPGSDDLFQPPAGGLQIPGSAGVVSGVGEMLVCYGISGEGERASALVAFNDTVRIVKAGDTLPPRYKVESVTADGVIIKDLRTDENRWMPVGGSAMGSGGFSTADRSSVGCTTPN